MGTMRRWMSWRGTEARPRSPSSVTVRGQAHVRVRWLLPVLLAWWVPACGGSGDPTTPGNGNGGGNGGGGGGGPGTAVPVVIYTTDQSQFVEEESLVPVGGIVRWISDSGLLHSVTPVGHDEFDRVEANQRGVVMIEHTFDEPGTYEFQCDYHVGLGMVGRVVVHHN